MLDRCFNKQPVFTYFDVSIEKARKIVLENILKKNVDVYLVRHAALWSQFYELSFSNGGGRDRILRTPDGVNLRQEFGLHDKTFRKPDWTYNLEDYFLKDSKQWNIVLELISFLDSSLV